MTFDFWNNPIVVSAFRVKQRRGELFGTSFFYLVILSVGAAALFYYEPQLGVPAPPIVFAALLTLQFFVSCGIAFGATYTSMRTEVVGRTLDFQRITALSPRQLLLGKLLGEAALAYLLPVATVPIAVGCWLTGGVALPVLILGYVNVLSAATLFGVLGLDQPLDPSAIQRGKRSQVPAASWAALALVMALPAMAPAATKVIDRVNFPLAVALHGDVLFNWQLSSFGLSVPVLILLPLLEAWAAFAVFHSVVRRLQSPLLPPVAKRTAYMTLPFLYMIVGGILHDYGAGTLTLQFRIALFCLFAFLMGLFAIARTTPQRAALESWVWRFRGRRPRWRDRWLGDRSPNGPAALTVLILGLFGLAVFVVLPGVCAGNWNEVQEAADGLCKSSVLLAVLTLVMAALMQGIALFLPGGLPLVMVYVFVTFAAPEIVGAIYQRPDIEAFGPVAAFLAWSAQQPALAPAPTWGQLAPVLIVHGSVLLLAVGLIRRRINRLSRRVDAQLRQMGVAS